VKTWAQTATVVIIGVVVGVVAYLVALAAGASHTACSTSGGTGFCDTHASSSAVVALLAGALCGAAVAVWTLHGRRFARNR
jgi:hypothetical protein